MKLIKEIKKNNQGVIDIIVDEDYKLLADFLKKEITSDFVNYSVLSNVLDSLKLNHFASFKFDGKEYSVDLNNKDIVINNNQDKNITLKINFNSFYEAFFTWFDFLSQEDQKKDRKSAEKQWILNTLKKTKINIKFLDDQTSEDFRESFLHKYCSEKEVKGFYWEALRDDINITSNLDEEGWEKISIWIGDRSCKLLFPDYRDDTVYELKSGKDLFEILDNIPEIDEFCVTDEDFSYFLCFNHHDYIIGAGSAYEWVLSLSEDYEQKKAK